MDQNYEPMEIDLSAHSYSPMDISYNSSSSATEIDTYLEADDFKLPPAASAPREPIVPTACTSPNAPQSTNKQNFRVLAKNLPHNVKKQSFTISFKTKSICSVIILLLSLATYQILDIQCSNDINPNELSKSLPSKLFGQSRAINSLIEALSVSERSKLLLFYGGTGVGKTLTASLILEHVGRYSNVYHYIMPSFMATFTTDFMIGLSVCKHTTIIIDDLSAKDMNVKSHIQNVITKSQNLGKDITVILIYNCDNAAYDFERQCDESFPNKLLQNFSHIDAFKKLIKFEALKEEHLRQCIETELRNRSLSNIEFNKLLKNFNVSLDGCKGVHRKMKMLEIL